MPKNITVDANFVSIDSASTRDIDDAFFIEQNETGFHIIVAIANAAAHVAIGSAEDINAAQLGATVYAADRVVRSMLPFRISEEKGSLKALKKRPAIVLDLRLDWHLDVTTFTLSSAPVVVQHRLAYSDIPEIIKQPEHVLNKQMKLAESVGLQLLRHRRERGAMALFDLTRLLLTDEDGQLVQVEDAKDTIGQIIVQEMMILTNRLMAEYMAHNNIPCIYRNHEARVSAPPVADLCKTIDGWLHGTTFSPDVAKKQLAMVSTKSIYEATIRGHYALNLAAYVHMSSPLRRYPDLVNQRQLVAFLGGSPLPYSQERILEIATGVNEVIERRKQERVEGFKTALSRVASAAITVGQLAQLADHELVAAIKLSRAAQQLPEPVEAEIMRRMQVDAITDKLAVALVADVPVTIFSQALRDAFCAWVSGHRPRAIGYLLHGERLGVFRALTVTDGPPDESGQFRCIAAMATEAAVETPLSAVATASTKRAAQHDAATALLCLAFGGAPVSAGKKRISVAGENTKGKLLELCQARKLPSPVFTATSKGPAHLTTFDCIVELNVGSEVIIARAADAGTKREAEMLAAGALLELIPDKALKTPMVPASESPDANPIGKLMELCQAQKSKPPEFSFTAGTQLSEPFQCTVVVALNRPISASATGINKKAAKTAAALAALAEICGNY